MTTSKSAFVGHFLVLTTLFLQCSHAFQHPASGLKAAQQRFIALLRAASVTDTKEKEQLKKRARRRQQGLQPKLPLSPKAFEQEMEDYMALETVREELEERIAASADDDDDKFRQNRDQNGFFASVEKKPKTSSNGSGEDEEEDTDSLGVAGMLLLAAAGLGVVAEAQSLVELVVLGSVSAVAFGVAKDALLDMKAAKMEEEEKSSLEALSFSEDESSAINLPRYWADAKSLAEQQKLGQMSPGDPVLYRKTQDSGLPRQWSALKAFVAESQTQTTGSDDDDGKTTTLDVLSLEEEVVALPKQSDNSGGDWPAAPTLAEDLEHPDAGNIAATQGAAVATREEEPFPLAVVPDEAPLDDGWAVHTEPLTLTVNEASLYDITSSLDPEPDVAELELEQGIGQLLEQDLRLEIEQNPEIEQDLEQDLEQEVTDLPPEEEIQPALATKEELKEERKPWQQPKPLREVPAALRKQYPFSMFKPIMADLGFVADPSVTLEGNYLTRPEIKKNGIVGPDPKTAIMLWHPSQVPMFWLVSSFNTNQQHLLEDSPNNFVLQPDPLLLPRQRNTKTNPSPAASVPGLNE